MKAQRQVNLEILRILCMLFIVTGHIGAGSKYSLPVTIAPHAVNCFVLISGYFLINAKFKSERLLRIIIETLFYSFTITLILYFCGRVDLISVIKSIMPFAPTRFSYWFVNKYLGVIMLSPFISKACVNINKKQYQTLLVSLLLISSTLFLFFPLGGLFGNGFSLLWMITLFITGGYLRLHTPNFKYWGIATILLLLLWNVCDLYLRNFVLLGYNSLITYALGITTFMFFKNLSIKDRGFIAKSTIFIAPHIFATYLIHAQPLLIGYIITIMYNSSGFILDKLYLYLFGIIIMVLSAIIDKGRIQLFKYIGVDRLIDKIACRLNKLYE